MGFIGSFLGKVAGEAVNKGAEVAKQKLADNRAAKEAIAHETIKMTKYGKKVKLNSNNFTNKEQKELGISYGDFDGYCWRVEDYDGLNLTLVKIKGERKGTTLVVSEDKAKIAE